MPIPIAIPIQQLDNDEYHSSISKCVAIKLAIDLLNIT